MVNLKGGLKRNLVNLALPLSREGDIDSVRRCPFGHTLSKRALPTVWLEQEQLLSSTSWVWDRRPVVKHMLLGSDSGTATPKGGGRPKAALLWICTHVSPHQEKGCLYRYHLQCRHMPL